MTKIINCLFTAVEADPLVKVGGLADVAFALPHALKMLKAHEIEQSKIDIRLMIPCHDTACEEVRRSKKRYEFEVQTAAEIIPAVAFETVINDLPIYLIASPYIPEKTTVYSSDAYHDGRKFLFFSRAVLELCKAMHWKPDLIHANDWHTSITNYIIKSNRKMGDFFQETKLIITIHNLPFMGSGAEKALEEMGIEYSKDTKLPLWARKIPLPMGLSASDKIIAVSPTYANEIQTSEFGCGLENYLKSRATDITGIINGIDTQSWDPNKDQALFANFSTENLEQRKDNKQILQAEMGLELASDTPLIAYIGRMDQQKGVDLIIEALEHCKGHALQAIILGTGNKELEEKSRQLEARHGEYVRSVIRFDAKLARKIYAGADILLMPSRYEPCGLAQMIAMRYGCVPIAHSTGGLKDTISDISDGNKGTGYLFKEATSQALAERLVKAIHDYKDREKWRCYQINGMAKDFSWKSSAKKYAYVYLDLLRSN